MKRSGQVALVVMAATGVGATSYALRPADDCAQQPGAHSEVCRVSWGGSGGHGYYSYSTPRGPSASQPRSTSTALVGGSTERGGFGSFARSVGAHFSGG